MDFIKICFFGGFLENSAKVKLVEGTTDKQLIGNDTQNYIAPNWDNKTDPKARE